MARTELDTKKLKRKAKKRKHETQPAGSDDEVADKSVIVEEKQVESETHMEEEPPRKDKAPKRKQKAENGVIKEKRSKPTNDSKDAANEEELDDMPTTEQLAEAAKPENSNAVVTVRQKKKQKHMQRMEEKKCHSSDKEAKRNEEYLVKWRDSREEWKFVKLRQISIQQTAFDEQKLSTDVWPIALEYLAASKGASKTTITKLAQDAIEEMDKKCEELTDDAERQTILDSTRYQRARDLLQSFD